MREYYGGPSYDGLRDVPCEVRPENKRSWTSNMAAMDNGCDFATKK
jgi:hypothetical protein